MISFKKKKNGNFATTKRKCTQRTGEKSRRYPNFHAANRRFPDTTDEKTLFQRIVEKFHPPTGRGPHARDPNPPAGGISDFVRRGILRKGIPVRSQADARLKFEPL